MKLIKLISSLTLLCTTVFFANAQTKDVVISGTLQQMKVMPSKVYLLYLPLLNMEPDSAEVKNGSYHLLASTGGVVASATLTTDLKVKAGPHTTQLVLSKGELNVLSTGDLFSTQVTGPAAGPQMEMEEMLKPIQEEKIAFKKAMESAQYQTDPKFKAEVQGRTGHILTASMQAMLDYALKKPNSTLSPYLNYMLFLLPAFPAKLDSLQQNLPVATPQLFRAEISRIVNERKEEAEKAAARRKVMDEKLPVGSKAIDFTMKNTAGKPVSLKSFKGKYVLVDFWASWCLPCRAENPNLVKAYNSYKNKGFTVLGVSLDGPAQKDAWLAAIKKDGLSWTEVSELNGWQSEVAKAYGVSYIPQNFLLGPDGVVIGKNLRGEELQKKLASLFKK